jgi:metallo-beta-lactamase class B
MKNALTGIFLLFCTPLMHAQLAEDPPKDCRNCESWNQPQEPYRVYGNTWYVGTAGLASILIKTDEGLILLDGALSQSAGQIEQNIRKLGFDPGEIRYLLNSHAHYDHAGGLNALQKLSQAQVLASVDSVEVLSTGELAPEDPQFGFGSEHNRFPAVSNVSEVADGGKVTLGEVTLTAHYTPGHTPGGTTWTWQSCEEGGCLDVVYADSLSAVSAEGFRVTDPSRTPTVAEQITASAQLVRELDCDVLLAPHPFLFQMPEKLEAMASNPNTNPFIDTAACDAYAAYFDDWLVRRLEEEAAEDSMVSDCGPAGDYSFVCGMKSAEDLVLVPGTKWIIASGFAEGGFYLVDSEQKTFSALPTSDGPGASQDMELFGACPGSPDTNELVTHGLNIRPGEDGLSTLYVVAHGARESIEVFDVDATGEAPVLTWKGCILTPDAQEANSVASLADGTLLVTIPLHTGIDISEALAGKLTGQVYRWSPGDSGMTPVQGTEMPYANGIEVSDDGKEFYVASSGWFTVTAFSNTNPAQVLRSSDTLTFVPDNLHMSSDGKLVTAGLHVEDSACGRVLQSEAFSLEAFASCPRPFTVWSIDPQTMQGKALASGPANPNFSNITMGLEAGGKLWIGTFAGDRIAYRTMYQTD